MSINFYKELGKDRKLITVKYPKGKEDGAGWEYVICDKNDIKKVTDKIRAGEIKDMKTILHNTMEIILKAKNDNK